MAEPKGPLHAEPDARMGVSLDMGATYELPHEVTIGGSNPGGNRRGEAAALTRGMQLGRYVVLNKLGAGGMGVVYAAYDPELDRKLAIKVLRRPGAAKTRHGVSRLQREAQALARVDHPNVVAIHDVGTHAGRVFVAMDFLDGPTLRAWTLAATRSWREVVAAYLEAGRGLAAAHEAGIVHRDFKPENVIVAEGRPRVVDFGLARASGTSSASDSYASLTGSGGDDGALNLETSGRRMPGDSHSLGQPITRAGAVLGTPAFMAPEQHLGEPTGPATDQFAFAIALHEALYGESPFSGETVAARAFAVTQGNVNAAPKSAPSHLRSPAPAWVRKALLRALATDPGSRWPDMASLLAELSRDPAATRRKWALGLALFGSASAAAVMWTAKAAPQAATCPDPVAALDEAWSPAKAQALDKVFSQSKLPYAAKVRQATVSALDDYAREWSRIHGETCTATRIRREQSVELMDKKMACLDSARRRLGAASARLTQGDALALEHGPELLAGLPQLSRCEASEQLLSGYPAPRGAQAAEVARVDAALAAVLAQRSAGELTKALAQLEDLLAKLNADDGATTLDYPPLHAALGLAHAELLEAVGQPREAEAALRTAMQAAEWARDEHRVAELRILAGLIIGDRLSRTDEGYHWLELARPTLARIGNAPQLEARRLNNLALVHSAAGKYTEELAAKRAALAQLERMPQPDPVQVAAVHNNLAASLSTQGQHDQAIEHAQLAIDTWSTQLGPDHPKVAIGYASLGLAYDYKGDYTRALEAHEHALKLLEASFGGHSPRAGEVLNNLAITAINLGDLPRGVAIFERVVDIKRAALGNEHLEVASALGNWGSALRMNDKLADAIVVQEQARDILEQNLPPDHPRLAGPLGGLANSYEELGRIAESLELRERVLRIEVNAHGPTSPEVAVDLGNLAWALVDAGKHRRARELATQGQAILAKHELKPDVEAFLLLVSARARLTAPGARAGARAQVEQALTVLGELPASTERDMVTKIAEEQGWRELSASPDAPASD